MAETPSKYFTVEDIVTEYDQWRDCICRFEVLAVTSKSEVVREVSR